ncbi:MAG: 50S ribosomal protein L11 methyltransferase [Desulfobacteraceae bacterium]|jgi:ribosomal protein L11 methyltransferase
MKFEIVIEGEPRSISKLLQKLKPILPATENGLGPTDQSDEKARIVLLESREGLPFRLLKISRIISKLNKDRLLNADFDLRVRNLAYSEPTVESHLLKKPFKPIPSMTIQFWDPSLPPATDAETIKIYSHYSFGTGKHPTTRLCLMYLDNMTHNPSLDWRLQGREVLDFGCGTGILAIAAVKMGAKKALGVEIDPQSAQTAKKNVEINGLTEKILIKQGSWEVVEGKFDLILANLVTAALFRAGKYIPSYLKDDGRIVISGFSTNQQGEIKEFFRKQGLVATDRSSLKDWSAMLLVKKGHLRS